MTALVVACVYDGHGFERILELRDAVEQHLPLPYEMACLTDRTDRCSGVTFIDITAANLDGWRAKMVLFEPQWRFRRKIIYLDLDVEVVGDLSPLADVPGEFSILADFNPDAMVIGALMGEMIWRDFQRQRATSRAKCLSDCIKELYPDAPFLEDELPNGFFRDRLIV